MNIKTKYLAIYIILYFLLTGSVILTDKILAQETTEAANIQYPVEGLGSCQSQTDCRAYCDKPKNLKVCLDFAEKNNLMSDEEMAQAKKFLAAGGEGPGGCASKDACEEYCNDMSHIDECISFAEENNLIPAKELEEAKKVQSAIARGVKPPPCGNKKSCDAYCEDSEHMEECVTFAVEAGFIQGKEAEDAQKMLQAVKRGVKPPPCRGREACDEYCSSPDNMELCINFAMEAGFMSEQEKADSQKMLQALKKGIKPPPCKGKDECDVYCQQEDHLEECMNFAVAAGFMDEKDAEMARKTGGKGPGGCKGKEECENFCNNPDNQEICFNFAKDNGMIPEEDLKQMEEGKQKLQQSLQEMPQEVFDCLQAEIGSDMVEKIKNGVMPQREIGDKMRTCFEKMGPPPGQENKNFQPGPGQVNPGGKMVPQQAGPGGCKSPEECQKYCENNPDDCKNFGQRPDNRQEDSRLENKMPPCEGENCQNGPGPGPGPGYQGGGELKPPQGMDCSSPAECEAKTRQQIEQQVKNGIRQGFEGQIPSGQQRQPAPNENVSPPPPPPSGAFFKPESFAGAVLYIIAKALYSVR